MFEYSGAVHIHSVFSDGSGNPGEIAGFANETGLDFILLSDHNTLRALHEGFEGWYDNTLMLVGCEINDKNNKNHYLAFGIDETISTRIPAKEYVRIVKEKGGIGFTAHPHEKRTSMKEHPPYPWEEWDTDDFTGIEIWNHMSEWMEGLTEQNKVQSFLHPLKSIELPPAETLAKWDEIAQRRKVVGIGGIDAHAHKVNLMGFFEVEVFPYKVLFKSIRTHILTDTKLVRGDGSEELKLAKENIYGSLRKGMCFVSNYSQGDARGFRFYAENGEAIYQMGQDMELTDNVKLRVDLPNVAGEIKLIRNGELYNKIEDVEAVFDVNEPGTYRVEVFYEGKAWIYSNHIGVGLKRK